MNMRTHAVFTRPIEKADLASDECFGVDRKTFQSEDKSRDLVPWLSRWRITADRLAYVLAYAPGEAPRAVDIRYWIETLHDPDEWPSDTTFVVVVEEDKP